MTWITAGIFGYELHKVERGCICTLWWTGAVWEMAERPTGKILVFSGRTFEEVEMVKASVLRLYRKGELE